MGLIRGTERLEQVSAAMEWKGGLKNVFLWVHSPSCWGESYTNGGEVAYSVGTGVK